MLFLTEALANQKPAVTGAVVVKFNSFQGENFIILSRHYHDGERSVVKDYIAKKCDTLDNHTIHILKFLVSNNLHLKIYYEGVIASVWFIYIVYYPLQFM